MSNLIQAAKDQVASLTQAAYERAAAEGVLPAGAQVKATIEIPKDVKNGDYASSFAMAGAKAMHMAPRAIAQAIVDHMDLAGSFFDRVEIAGPGFLNFTLGAKWYGQVLADIEAEGKDYGRSDEGRGEKIMVEFVSANPTGPMHMGNARGGALGDGLASALDWAGYQVTREFYVNDAGNQVEKFGASLEARYLQLYLGEEAVPFPEDGYHGEDITQRARQFAQLHGDAYVQADSEARKKALVEFALPLNIEKLRTDLERYRITYDVWFRESTLHPDAVNAAIQKLADRGMTYEKEGAIWYKATENGGEKDEVLVRANGIPTYFAADIAYHYNKFAVRGFERVVNVWGADHHGHVARLKGAMDAIGLDGSKLDIVLMQLVRLMKDGQPYKMSKRTGKAISLTDLLEEVPVDAARFFFNMREPNSTLDFDLDLAVEQSSQNPVYYVQYAHARICSILKKLEEEGIQPRACNDQELLALTRPEESALIRCLARFPQEVVDAAKNYDPARLTKYAIQVATDFHKYYNACRVKGECDSLLQARLNLCLATRQVLRNLLSLLKISAPESM